MDLQEESMRFLRLALIGMFAVSMLVAAPISYTITGFLNGSLDATPFAAEPFTVVINADTAGVNLALPGILYNPAFSTSISITGVGSGSFVSSMIVGVNYLDGIIGFTDGSVGGVTFQNAGAIGWDLASPIGPLTAASPFYAAGTLPTTFGTLTITGARDLSFSADTGVPEPSTGLLVAAALAAAIGLRRKLA